MTDTSFATLAARPNAHVLIIGGGINGLATFRDLAMQGVDVILVEKNDFVSGASAASSHMIHGGIRYLENGEFRLVHEAVTERNGLLKIAPHYVRPLQTTIPIYSTFRGLLSAPLRFLRHGKGKASERGAALIKVGLVIYDFFSRGGGRVPRHTFLRRKKSLQILPELNPALKYTATYWDASIHDPERLALDVLRDGQRVGRDRARAINYAAVTGVDEAGRVIVTDSDTGESVAVSAPVVVNASGPWTDQTNAALGQPTHFMGGTKGSHIVLDHPELLAATGGRELFFEHKDGRIVLIYPLKGRVLVGTSDLEHDMNEPIECTEAEIDYFFALIRHVLPNIEVDRSQIVFRFAGVRPLPGHGDLAPGFVSRDYRIERSRLGSSTLLSLVGGKWTTFRASAETLANRVLDELGLSRVRSTRRFGIGGGVRFPTTDAARSAWIAGNDALGPERAAHYLERYGSYAAEVISAISTDPDDHPLAAAPEYSTGELRFLARAEQVRHLDDLLYRRTNLAFLGFGLTAAQEVADAVAGDLGWDAARVREELVRVERMLAAV